MEEERYVIPHYPAGVSELVMELHSESTIDSGAKDSLTNCLTSVIPAGKQAKVLILGARCGLTAEIMLPISSHLDLIQTDEFKTLLQERFVKGKEVSYFFGKQGFIGSQEMIPKVSTGTTQVRVISASDFGSQVLPHYDVVVLQNCIITSEINLVKELIKIQHDFLVTMLVPGYIIRKNFFPFVCTLEKLVLNEFYNKEFQEQIQSKKNITGRRTEIFFYEVFGWKKNDNNEQTQTKVSAILEQAEKQTIVKGPDSQPSHSNPYETQELVNVYNNFHFGPDSLGVENYPSACAKVCIQKAKDHKIVGGRVLDLGCAVGRTSIDLAEYFDSVVGLDFSAAFIKAAQVTVAESYEKVSSKLKFVVGDACNLNPCLGKFNVIFGGNLIDRLPDPAAFLTTVCDFLEPNGLLILTSPYSWLEQFTPHDKWIGGFMENGKPVTTNEGLARNLTKVGLKELCPSENIRFSIKDNDWVFQYTLACATFWVKK